MRDATTLGWPELLGPAIALLAVLVAVFVSWFQLRYQRSLLAIERSVGMHRDITSGEVGQARDRLSEFMWRVGSRSGSNHCYRPSWEELLGGTYLSLAEGSSDLSSYPADIASGTNVTPSRDLYKILWCFERVAAEFSGRLIDQELATHLLGNHVVWWDALCLNIPLQATRYRKNLNDLAARFDELDAKLRPWALADFE